MAESKKIKVYNPNLFMVGLRLMDGLREVIVHPKSFVLLDENDIYYINNMSRIFRNKHLIVEDDEVNANMGYADKTAANLTDAEIEGLLRGNIMKMKKELNDIHEKHIKDRIINIAKKIEDLNMNKVKFLEEWSGYDFKEVINESNNNEN